MAINLPQGTKEYLLIDVTDALAGIGSLAGTTPQYKVYDPSGSIQIDWTAAVASGMTAKCMIDTTSGTWVPGEYMLYFRLTASPEVPKLGPHRFNIVAQPDI